MADTMVIDDATAGIVWVGAQESNVDTAPCAASIPKTNSIGSGALKQFTKCLRRTVHGHVGGVV